MALTNSLKAVGKYLHDEIYLNQETLGLKKVMYGDQSKIGEVPLLCVETDNKTQELAGVPRAVLVNMFVWILIYHALVKDTQITREAIETLTEGVETFIHASSRSTMGGLVTHQFVRGTEYGYATRSGALLYTTRMQVHATSKVLLPSPIT